MKNDLQEIIKNATKAPSGHNTQPWKFSVNEKKGIVKLFPDFSRRLPVVDADNHALYISLGCATENMVIAAIHFGYTAKVDLFPDDEKEEYIKVTLTKDSVTNDGQLFNAIEKRQSTRSDYDGRLIAEDDFGQLKNTAKQDGVELIIFTTKQEKESLLPFISEGVVLQFSNKNFVNELTDWIRFNKSSAEAKADGLFGKVMGSPSVPTWFGKLMVKSTGAQKEAAKTIKQVMGSSALLLFIATANTKENWVNLGRSFERVVLTATSLNIKHAHVNMPCEEISVRNRMQQHFNLGDKHPLLLIRIGYGELRPYSYRRQLNEVMVDET